jgi:hypothetical protein
MSYARGGSATPVPRVPRLGLRARWRATREARMSSERARRRLAQDLERAEARAEEPHAPFSAVVPVHREAVHLAHGALLDLAERLRAPRPVDPAGVRLARALLFDGGGPLYVPMHVDDLREAAVRALAALDGHVDVC